VTISCCCEGLREGRFRSSAVIASDGLTPVNVRRRWLLVLVNVPRGIAAVAGLSAADTVA
jgi:hypothetical protein